MVPSISETPCCKYMWYDYYSACSRTQCTAYQLDTHRKQPATCMQKLQYMKQAPNCTSITQRVTESHTSLSTMKRPRSATPSSVSTLYFLLISLFRSDTRGYFSSPTPPSFLSATQSTNLSGRMLYEGYIRHIYLLMIAELIRQGFDPPVWHHAK